MFTKKLISSFINYIFDNNNPINLNITRMDQKFHNVMEIKDMIKFIDQSNNRGIAKLINE